ncbi:cytochrome P450 3A24-like [Gigantopelta aegis]|uniref:cytochrome P450 3A24-like n=1 Tax=Gigantopelta aegis TaxID=1735272 RepID=UPI001B88D901|nr:cytochrome P450 3A24-like [Gigantopelta aegis]
MQIFNDMGVHGPTPNFLFGNLLSLRNMGFHKIYQVWNKMYGKTFGYFEGPSPVLVTSDEKILHQVFVKQFSKFHARKVFPVQVDPDYDENVHMFFARGDRWKRLRSIANPAFSSAKLRKMVPILNDCFTTLVATVKSTSDAVADVDIRDLFQRLTLDTISRCGFGLDSRSIENLDDSFFKHCKGVIADTTKRPWLFLFGFIFPALHALWIAIYKLLGYLQYNPVFWLEKQLGDVIQDRKNENYRRDDLLQLMIDAKFVDENCNVIPKEQVTKEMIMKKLTNDEIIAQSFLFMLAGFETTSTTLSYVFYELATNPDVQKKLRDEVDQHFPTKDDKPCYDSVSKLQYLDMVICETLRKYPLASGVIARKCMETCEVEGLIIPKDTIVQADVWSLHRRRDLWGDDVESFNPERFTPEKKLERHPMAWMAFGGGPRSCAGLRFALLQMKMVTVELVKNFILLPAKNLEKPLTLTEGATVIPKFGINLNVISRGK